MICCEEKPTVPNLAVPLKQAALDDVKQKKVLGNAYFLLGCSSPYSAPYGIVITDEQGTKVFDCGKLVFHWGYGGLKKYICGDWTDVLSTEVQAIKNQRTQVKAYDQKQALVNKFAARNYVMC